MSTTANSILVRQWFVFVFVLWMLDVYAVRTHCTVVRYLFIYFMVLLLLCESASVHILIFLGHNNEKKKQIKERVSREGHFLLLVWTLNCLRCVCASDAYQFFKMNAWVCVHKPCRCYRSSIVLTSFGKLKNDENKKIRDFEVMKLLSIQSLRSLRLLMKAQFYNGNVSWLSVH